MGVLQVLIGALSVLLRAQPDLLAGEKEQGTSRIYASVGTSTESFGIKLLLGSGLGLSTLPNRQHLRNLLTLSCSPLLTDCGLAAAAAGCAMVSPGCSDEDRLLASIDGQISRIEHARALLEPPWDGASSHAASTGCLPTS